MGNNDHSYGNADNNMDYELMTLTAVLRIRIRGIRIVSLDPDPYKKLPGSGSKKTHRKLKITFNFLTLI